jgi:hypothetical protein
MTDFSTQQVRRKPVLGGLINEYARRLTTEDLQVTSTILFASGPALSKRVSAFRMRGTSM